MKIILNFLYFCSWDISTRNEARELTKGIQLLELTASAVTFRRTDKSTKTSKKGNLKTSV